MTKSHKDALAVFERVLKRRNCAPATIECLLGAARFFLARIKKPITRIKREDVRRYLAERASTLSPQSHWSEMSRLRAFFRALVTEGVVAEAPTDELEVPYPPEALQLFLSSNGVERLLRSAVVPSRWHKRTRHAVALRDRAAIELLYALGLRASEASEARVVDLQLGEKSLLVRRAKRGESRVFPLPERAVKHLEIYLRDGRPKLVRANGAEQGRLLVTRYGTPFDREGIWVIVTRVARKAGLRAHPHALRRSFATHLMRAGVNARAVSELLGHQSLETTARYLAVDRDELRRAVTFLERRDPPQ